MPAKSPSAALIAAYDGAHGQRGPCTSEQWEAIGPFFRQTMAPLASLPVGRIRRTATPLVRLCVFALRQGAPLDLAVILQPAFLEAFLATLPAGAPDARSALRDLARAHGIDTASTPLGYSRRPATASYDDSEIDALQLFAAHMRTDNQRLSLQALIALGAGAGLVRDALRDVTATAVHHHGHRIFVAAVGRCSYVLPRFVDVLHGVCEARPDGWLLGTQPKRNLTSHIVAWCHNRVGVPELSPDRLRSTYLRELFESDLSFREIVLSSGLQDFSRLAEFAALWRADYPACPEGTPGS